MFSSKAFLIISAPFDLYSLLFKEMATLPVLHKVKLKSRVQHRGAHVSSHCRGPFSTVARCGVCAESHMHFSVTSDSELAVKYRFHLPLPKASSCFILDWPHYKRTSVKHFTVTPWWRRFALKAPALCPGPSERGGSVSLLGGYPSGAREPRFVQTITAYSSCAKSPQSVLPSPQDLTTAPDSSSTYWKVPPGHSSLQMARWV